MCGSKCSFSIVLTTILDLLFSIVGDIWVVLDRYDNKRTSKIEIISATKKALLKYIDLHRYFNMPELPEVETIRTQLAERLIGQKITEVDVRLPKIFTGDQTLILGATIEDVVRRGKIILIVLSNKTTIVIHLKMSGKLLFTDSKYVNLALCLSDGNILFFSDHRKFGWVKIIPNENLQTMVHQKLGPEPLEREFSDEYLASICKGTKRVVKTMIMDQTKIAGIGNIYACESLWLAKINPFRKANSLTNKEVLELRRGIIEILKLGILQKGSSFKDKMYQSVHGEGGLMQNYFNVYQRKGQKCPRCGEKIVSEKLIGRGTFYCKNCQV